MIRATLRRVAPQIFILGLVLLLNFLLSPGFFKVEMHQGRLFGNLIDVLNRGAPVALLSIGMTLVIATRGIDLSVGAVMAIAGAVAASVVTEGSHWLVAVFAALGAGALCGLWNGVLVAIFRIQPIVATLVLMVAGRGIAQLLTHGAILTFNDPGLVRLGGGTIFSVPTPIWLWIALALIVGIVVRRSALGLLIEATGINERSARLAGINARVLLVAVYLVAGLCAAIAGIVVAGDIRGADANNAGLWMELDAILAVVIGGNSLLGGRFSITASLLGALIIQSVNSAILLSGMPVEFNLVIKALIIIAILVIQSPRIKHSLYLLRASSGTQPPVERPSAPRRRSAGTERITEEGRT
ncbi:ABC transporter permease [Thioclava atlantica]|uniref:Ribose ABC transporter permease n=1 Tax=Thioclava atlantica TaxID=1317124 RepID=A0A085TXK5_9RHOB|nr:ABC transporter permease [Thioclava atlantica]KFE35452.1 ribose ABC transporter permease [Thioclava atlantica]